MKPKEKLAPLFLRREDEPEYQREIWQPDWQCFCCEDTGEAIHAARRFIDGYDGCKHKLVICQNPHCAAGRKLGTSPALQASLDWRLGREICIEVDLAQRQIWREEAQRQQPEKIEIDVSGIGFNLRGRSRTPTEEMEAQQRHQAVLAGLEIISS